jgi:hypothetical protein
MSECRCRMDVMVDGGMLRRVWIASRIEVMQSARAMVVGLGREA